MGGGGGVGVGGAVAGGGGLVRVCFAMSGPPLGSTAWGGWGFSWGSVIYSTIPNSARVCLWVCVLPSFCTRVNVWAQRLHSSRGKGNRREFSGGGFMPLHVWKWDGQQSRCGQRLAAAQTQTANTWEIIFQSLGIRRDGGYLVNLASENLFACERLNHWLLMIKLINEQLPKWKLRSSKSCLCPLNTNECLLLKLHWGPFAHSASSIQLIWSNNWKLNLLCSTAALLVNMAFNNLQDLRLIFSKLTASCFLLITSV